MTQQPAAPAAMAAPGGRIVWLDLARSAALVGMAIYHFRYDLAMYGVAPVEPLMAGFWPWLARIVAGSFLLLAGFSLVLGHGRGIRWRGYWIRQGQIAAAAALITLVTYFAVHDAFIFFGILHMIFTAGLIGLAFLRAPGWVSALAAALVVLVAMRVSGGVFDWPVLWFLGLAEVQVFSVDFEPVFPWLAPYLAGMALAQWAVAGGLIARLRAAAPAPRWARVLAWPGRHSLIIYLLHQPVLIGLLILALMVLR